MTQLPPDLAAAIDAMAAGGDHAALARAAQDISARYRRETSETLQLRSEVEALAYACTRMPATYAAVSRALAQVGVAPASVMDFGAGPGTASLAARALWPDARIIMTEINASMRAIARRLVADASWTDAPAAADVVIAAYVLNEMPDAAACADMLWERSADTLVLVDAGTPAVQAMMLRVRDRLIAAGGHIHAPCPHHLPCPFAAQDSGWCHFSARLPRTRLHRTLKGGDLGYEDEKFTYLVVSRRPAPTRDSRIVGHPRTSKVIDMLLCRADGTLQAAQIGKRDPRYKQARKKDWGDTLADDV